MTPERYQIIKQVFNQALERPQEERPAYLASACADDPDLRTRVEALLNADEQPGEFLNAPAYEAAAELLMETPPDALVGTSLGPYQILSLLGAGGMGDVYLAKDTRLGRRVAVKLLPEYLTDDDSRVRRFKREARAASSLNHPNLITIYEIGQAEGRYFIAMEFVEGKTLRELIQAGRRELHESLRIASEVAGALAKAHQIGIVHRDIKPENIMLDADGRVKILDFGLAKQSVTSENSDAAVSAVENTRTVPGMIMGTTSYMSPEQARGLSVDSRTDIWSLGIVLYEMVSGGVPFPGSTRAHVLVAILDRELPLLTETFPPAAREELQKVLNRALAKDPAARHQTAEEMSADLERVRGVLRTATESGRSSAFESSGQVTASPPAALPRGRDRRWLVVGAVVLLSVIVMAGFMVRRWYRSKQPDPTAIKPAVVPPERSFSYWIEVQKYRDGKPFEAPFRLGREINFEKDYRVRLNFQAAQPGHLYLLNEGPAAPSKPPAFVVLFPSSTTNQGNSQLAGGGRLQIPEQSWLAFDAEQGTEKIWVVYSPDPIAELEALTRFTNSRDRGAITDQVSNQSVADFLRAHQNPPPAIISDQVKRETVVKSGDGMIVYLLGLEHH